MKGCFFRTIVFFAIAIALGAPIELYQVSKLGEMPNSIPYSKRKKSTMAELQENNTSRTEWLKARRAISGTTPLFTLLPSLILTNMIFKKRKNNRD